MIIMKGWFIINDALDAFYMQSARVTGSEMSLMCVVSLSLLSVYTLYVFRIGFVIKCTCSLRVSKYFRVLFMLESSRYNIPLKMQVYQIIYNPETQTFRNSNKYFWNNRAYYGLHFLVFVCKNFWCFVEELLRAYMICNRNEIVGFHPTRVLYYMDETVFAFITIFCM